MCVLLLFLFVFVASSSLLLLLLPTYVLLQRICEQFFRSSCDPLCTKLYPQYSSGAVMLASASTSSKWLKTGFAFCQLVCMVQRLSHRVGLGGAQLWDKVLNWLGSSAILAGGPRGVSMANDAPVVDRIIVHHDAAGLCLACRLVHQHPHVNSLVIPLGSLACPRRSSACCSPGTCTSSIWRLSGAVVFSSCFH